MSSPSSKAPEAIPNMPIPREITIIVAATNKMGIGRAGTLPWTGLKKEMAYFARVTKRAEPGKLNALIMGSKTYLSIPSRFRPLKDRLNIVLTRNPSSSLLKEIPSPFAESSFDEALSFATAVEITHKIFVIGGEQIYREALKRKEAKRILLTRVEGEFDCDAFFPVELGVEGKAEGKAEGWVKKGKGELDEWVGEETSEGGMEEGGVRYGFEMWERSREDGQG